MNRLTKAISIFLAVLMAATLLCIPGFAEPEANPYTEALNKGTGYVAIGDSFSRGYGASENWESQIYNNERYGTVNARNVDGSYPNLIAEAFGLYAPDNIFDTTAKFWPLTHDALSTAYMLDLLGIDDVYRDEELTYSDALISNRYKTDLAYYGDSRSFNFEGTGTYDKEPEIMSIHDMLDNASLITVSLGQTDVMYKAMALGIYNADFSDAGKIVSVVANVVSMLYENFEYWKNAYPLFLDYLKENNPNAKVVLIGTMNPFQNTMLSEEVLIPIGSAVNIITDLMNKYTKEFAGEYGYMYADISNIEIESTVKDTTMGDIFKYEAGSVDFALMTHPNAYGYAQIARIIVDKVKEAIDKENGIISETPKTYIKVDIGRFTDVNYVAVDAKAVKNYTVEDHVLTVPYTLSNAKNLTVTATKDDGTVTLITYNLKYDNGYSASRIYETNDLVNTIKITLKTIFSAIVNIFKSIFGIT